MNVGLLTFGVLIGSIIEQYDFLVTGTVAALIWPHVFFGPGTAWRNFISKREPELPSYERVLTFF